MCKLFYGLIFLILGCANTRVPVSTESSVPLAEVQIPSVQVTPTTITADSLKKQIQAFLNRGIQRGEIGAATQIQKVETDSLKNEVILTFNDNLGFLAWRERTVFAFIDSLKNFTTLTPIPKTLDQELWQLVPNPYREVLPRDNQRMISPVNRGNPIVNRGVQGHLSNRNIALWHSHGYYYEHKLDRWEFQRAPVFQTVEDVLPLQFVLPYLVPLLENAGANVFLPRERDLNAITIIIDNNDTKNYQEFAPRRQHFSDIPKGFSVGNLPYVANENPFTQGDARLAPQSARATFKTKVPAKGDFAVYATWTKSSAEQVNYQISAAHNILATGSLNQTIGEGTWIYLDTVPLEANEELEVTFSGDYFVADAVKIGGGMGNVARNGRISEMPKFMEGARYYLQTAGMPDSLTYNVSAPENDDYRDDFQGRAEWANYLRGGGFGANKNRALGLNIPIDLSLAFHTDAGIRRDGQSVGTLMIYSSKEAQGTRNFPDGRSRFANRDFADLLQTAIVDEIRSKWDSTWTRRQIWDKDYSEAFRPNMPSALIELLSHQNFYDMQYALDPQFRFDVSWAIYKGVVEFLSYQENKTPILQPLPPTHFSFTNLNLPELNWKDAKVWKSRNGQRTRVNASERIQKGALYQASIRNRNEGGISLPSEVLSLGFSATDTQKPILIINAFDRIAAPAFVQKNDFMGIADWEDQGVPDRFALGYVGKQYNFDATSAWKDDDEPGHGASYLNAAGQIIAGNTHDFTAIWGKAILANGRSFVSASDEAVWDGQVNLSDFDIVFILMGEEKTTCYPRAYKPCNFKQFPPIFQTQLRQFKQRGGKLFLSGAYVGTDNRATSDSAFVAEVFGYKYRTHHASQSGELQVYGNDLLANDIKMEFNQTLNSALYAAEAPDGIEPASTDFKTFLRYTDSNITAGIWGKGSVVLGFPFETLTIESERNRLMGAILKALE